MSRSLVILLAAALLCGVVAIGATADVALRGGPMADLTRVGSARAFAPRLSITTAHLPCAALPPADSGETVPREACDAYDDVPAVAEELVAAGESGDPESLRASALAAVIWWDRKESSLDAAVAGLERALRLSPDPVPLLVDLSGVHLARAERMQSARDLMDGLHYAREAIELDRSNKPALFNAALALTRQGIDGQSALAWDAYLAVDSTSPWADEARRRKKEALDHAPVLPAPGLGASAAEVDAFAEHHPGEARLLGWDDLLGQWGSAVETGDTARAASALRLAEMLGSALERRGGDASLADAVRAIRAAEPDAAATGVLARAHRMYAAAQELYRITEFQASSDSFAHVVASRPPSPVLVQSSSAFHGASLVYLEKFDEAHAIFGPLLDEVDTVRHPALAARARWMRGTAYLRDGQYAQARVQYAAAARGFERVGETEFLGAVLNFDGEATYQQGDNRAAYDIMHRALLLLRDHRESLWLHSALVQWAHCTTLDGMPLAAALIQEEDVAVAAHVHAPHPPVEALLARARVLMEAGRADLAAKDVDAAALLVPRMEGRTAREWFAAVLPYSRAVVAPNADLARSVAALDSAVAHFAKAKNVVWLIPALFRRADARLATGDLNGATADLNTATARIRGLSQGLANASLRAAMIEQARSRFDQLVMLHLRDGRSDEALRVLERGRVSFAPAADLSASPDGGPLAAPSGEVAVEYALVDDNLLIWTVRGTEVRFRSRKVDRDGLLRTVERAAYALETQAPVAVTRPELARLYDELIRPIAGDLGAPETPLVILTDGELAGIPFAALLDTARKRYVVEDRSIRFATTLADAARPALPADPMPRALLVANPDFDRLANSRLDRLRGARAEADALGAIYAKHVLLADADATRDSLTVEAPRASVIHYAGHAVFDDARPERSFLVLAGEGSAGRLSAEAVAGLELDGVRLVVLSACRTLRSRQGRSGGFAGLSGALLAAGVGGVVGSPWEVDDRLAQPLMLEFHRAYLATGDPDRALRKAQLKMLFSGDSALASPAAWAGFRYAGR